MQLFPSLNNAKAIIHNTINESNFDIINKIYLYKHYKIK